MRTKTQRQKNQEEKKLKTHFCEKHAYEIRQLCKPGQYNIVCHKYLGDVFYQVAMREQFEQHYGEKLHYIIRPEHQFLMEMFSVTDYSIYDFWDLEQAALGMEEKYMRWGAVHPGRTKLDVACKDLFPCVPLKGEPFIPDGEMIQLLLWDHYRSKLWAYNAGLEPRSVAFPLPRGMIGKSGLQTVGVAFRWVVLLAPDATTAIEIPVEIWDALANVIHEKGYKIIVNSAKYQIKHGVSTYALGLSLQDVVALGQRCAYVFSVRSGLCDVLTGIGKRLYAFYPAMLRREYGSLTKPFVESTGVNEIQFYEWRTSPITWEGEDLTPLIQQELDKLRRNWQRENWWFHLSWGEKKGAHLFWRNIFRDVAKKPSFYPENNVENPPPERIGKKVSVLGVPVYVRDTDTVKHITRKTFLGGLWHERRVGEYKKFCVCGVQVYSRGKRRKKLLGITLRRYDFDGLWLRTLAQRVGDAYDDVYLLRHDMGETYLELVHLEERARIHGSKHPVVVAREKKYEDVCRMLLLDGIAVRYIPLEQGDIHWAFREQGEEYREIMIEAEGHRFFCSTPHIAEHMLELLKKGSDTNFYRYICESTGVEPSTTKLLKPRVAAEDVARARQVRERERLEEGKYVVFLPETRSTEMLDASFWQHLAAEFTRRGYKVYTNRTDGGRDYLSVGALLELCRCAAGLVSMGSGMAVLLTSVGRQVDLIYTTLRLTRGRRCDAAKVMHLYSVHHLPGIDGQLVREYDGSKMRQGELGAQILDHYNAQ